VYVHSTVLAVAWCLSVTFWHCIKTAERITVGTGTIASLGKATYGDFHISKNKGTSMWSVIRNLEAFS